MRGVIFDLDQTLIDSLAAEAHRKARDWQRVYGLISSFMPYDGIDAVFQLLADADVPVCIVTSSPRPYCERVLKHWGFDVKHTVCYHDTNRRKPYPDPIIKGVECLGGDVSGIVAVATTLETFNRRERPRLRQSRLLGG